MFSLLQPSDVRSKIIPGMRKGCHTVMYQVVVISDSVVIRLVLTIHPDLVIPHMCQRPSTGDQPSV